MPAAKRDHRDGCSVNLGEAGKALIQSYEKCAFVAYKPTPNDVWTLGFGHTRAVAEGDTCTQEQADAWFVQDVAWAEECVNRAVTAQVSQEEFDALVSLCFNIGCPAFSGSTLVKELNAANYDAASQQFLVWDKQHGQVLAGLSARRRAEQELFNATA